MANAILQGLLVRWSQKTDITTCHMPQQPPNNHIALRMSQPVAAPVQEPSIVDDTFALIRNSARDSARILDGVYFVNSEQVQLWRDEAKRLYKEAVPQQLTIALVGRTGGKSTAMNAVFSKSPPSFVFRHVICLDLRTGIIFPCRTANLKCVFNITDMQCSRNLLPR